MNKIITNIGMIFFFLSMIYFTQRDFPIQDIIIRSLLVYIFLTFMFGIVAMFFVKSVNKAVQRKSKEMVENIIGTNNHE